MPIHAWRGGRLIRGVAMMLCAWTMACGAAAADKTAGSVVHPHATEKAQSAYGTYLKPFAAESPWNSRPLDPVFDDYAIPASDYYPLVASGKYSTGVFLASAKDGPQRIVGAPGSKGIWNPDAEAFETEMTIPRWPASVAAATGSDGHADIVDPLTGIVHSFWQLKVQDNKWTAAQYAWSRIDGRGWGDPAHYFQGARAAGVPTMAGLIRKHEVNDGKKLYAHALAMSMTFNGLSADPAYVFPATSADGNAAKTNSGGIPEGALLMLPSSFPAQSVAHPALRKIAETLKVYGAYVVDRNHGTPFFIYVENGAALNLHEGGWNRQAAADLQRIRESLRQVVSAASWRDGRDRPVDFRQKLNLLSLRGPWVRQSGPAAGAFDTWRQAILFPKTEERIVQMNFSGRGMGTTNWGNPAAGDMLRLTARATGGAKFRFELKQKNGGEVAFDSGPLGDGDTVQFAWPDAAVVPRLTAISGTGKASSIAAELLPVTPAH